MVFPPQSTLNGGEYITYSILAGQGRKPGISKNGPNSLKSQSKSQFFGIFFFRPPHRSPVVGHTLKIPSSPTTLLPLLCCLYKFASFIGGDATNTKGGELLVR